jgi:hypothetical protein
MHIPQRSPFLNASNSSSRYQGVIVEWNHLIFSHSAGGSRVRRYLIAASASFVLSKKTRNLFGGSSPCLKLSGMRKARLVYELTVYLISWTTRWIFGWSLEQVMCSVSRGRRCRIFVTSSKTSSGRVAEAT